MHFFLHVFSLDDETFFTMEKITSEMLLSFILILFGKGKQNNK